MAEEIIGQFRKNGREFRLITHEEEWKGKDINIEVVSSRRPYREFQSFKRIRKLTGIILSTIWYPEGLLAYFSRAKKKVVFAHGSELLPHPSKFKNFFLQIMKRSVFESADLVIANSHFTKKLVLGFAPKSNVVIIHPCVNPKKFLPKLGGEFPKGAGKLLPNYPSKKFIISTVAVVQEHKGFDVVFRAIQRLPERVKEKVAYLIAGNGPEVENLKQLASRMEIEDNIQWLGFVPEEKLIDVYHVSDLFVLCSKSMIEKRNVEGFGMVLLEAMACGVPVIGSKSGGIPEAIEFGGGGDLIEEGDDETLTKLIVKHFENKKVEVNNHSYIIENATWGNYCERLESALSKI